MNVTVFLNALEKSRAYRRLAMRESLPLVLNIRVPWVIVLKV